MIGGREPLTGVGEEQDAIGFLNGAQRLVSGLRNRKGFAFRCRRCFGLAQLFGRLAYQTPHALDEAMRSFDTGLGPDDVTIRGRIGENEEAGRIGAVGSDDVVGIDNILLRLRHLLD